MLTRASLLVAMLLSSSVLAAELPHVVVLESSELSAYRQVLAGFLAEARAEVETVVLPDGAEEAARTVQRLAAQRPALVLALGPAAATAARSGLSELPLVFGMVPFYERYGLEGQRVTGIALTNNLSVELGAVRSTLPGARRVGILHDPRFSANLLAEAGVTASRLGLSVVPLEIDSVEKVERTLKAAAGKVDVVVMVADKSVANVAVVKALLRFCAAANLPVIGLSPAMVKEGALLSLSPSYLGLGQQAARLVNRILHEKVNPGALAVAPPEVLELTVSLSAAKKLSPSCDAALQIFGYAARQGYPVKVLE